MNNKSKFNQISGLIATLMVVGIVFQSCEKVKPFKVEKGVSKALNDYRKQTISQLEYELFFNIPEEKSKAIDGKVSISFQHAENKKPLVIDFNETEDKVLMVKASGKEIDFRFENGHIIIPKKHIAEGRNSIEIDFVAGDLSLNRNDEFLYTLFVPDRASTAFPCFDQPNLKATYSLSLEVSSDWVAVANGELKQKEESEEQTVYHFRKTLPISTYLFSFAAGKFEQLSSKKNGRSITLYHRETNEKKIKDNLDRLFDLHFDALDWMEEYTGIKYPFGKFDFVAIPSFQYGGMEHPGAILYRSEKLFLDQTATQEQKLSRASLIAHETAHMWFGDLVTMAWFDDVWLKEVFANFMAAKIVNPAFQDIDHELAFLVDHYPKAYAIDRTAAANSIKQELENMNMAGTIYGSIIYHKAPIVMLQLEGLTGEENLRKGLREYLDLFAFSNADWDDLIRIIDGLSEKNLEEWSNVWVKEAGMPVYKATLKPPGVKIAQNDPDQKGRTWPQYLNIYSISGKDQKIISVFNDKPQFDFETAAEPELLVINGNGKAYGYFELNESDQDFITSERFFTLDPKTRATIYISVWENLLRANINAQSVADAFGLYLSLEENEQNVNLLLNYYPKFFWRYSNNSRRKHLSRTVEKLLWDKVLSADTPSLKSAYYKAMIKTAISDETIKKMYELWNGELKVEGLTISSDDLTTLAFELVVRRDGETSDFDMDHILEYQLESIENPDKRKRMEFIIPALSVDEQTRDAFFESLKNPSNREHEPWVLTALWYLHHPLRAESARKYILPSLKMLKEIQVTGDIFFPKGWLDATFSGHQSKLAADFVTVFLNNHPDLDPKLRQKLVQSADPLFRAAKMIDR